jgi:hypothetical protein
MTPQDLIALLAGLFIFGMIWLRTRTQYTRQQRGVLHLTPAGRLYFAAVVALLVLAWFVAPLVGRASATAMAASSTLVRVIGFLVIYYLFIAVHRILGRRRIAVFQGNG